MLIINRMPILIKEKCRAFIAHIRFVWHNTPRITKDTTYISLVILCVGFGSFLLGRLSVMAERREPVIVEESPIPVDPGISTMTKEINAPVEVPPTKGKYVGSRSSKKLHLPTCSGAKSLKEENKVWFATKEAALAAGFTPAANCRGI
jgi:hypothetical protein